MGRNAKKESRKTYLYKHLIIILSGGEEMNIKQLSLLILLVLLVACHGKKSSNHTQISNIEADSTYIPKYAKGFVINYFNDYRQIVLSDPWGDTTKNETIALVDNQELAQKLKASHDYVVRYPVKKWIALSSTMVNYADKLDMKHTIVGVAEPQYISDDFIQDAIQSGSIRNVGVAVAPDVEVMVDLEPDFMMVSPFKDNHFNAVTGAGIPVVTNSDYLEHTPLGRAEWLVFVGELLGKGNVAKQLFNNIEEEYLTVKKKANQAKNRPGVFTGHIYQGIWYTPAGESYMANYFNDAGCNYIYKDSKGTGSLSLDYETIIDKAELTEYWVLIMNYPRKISYDEIRNVDKRYVDFSAYKNQNIVVTNASNSLYFEKGLLQPHIVLSDLVYAFHPELLEGYQPKYFTHLRE